MALPGVRPQFLATIPGDSAAQTGHRAVPAQRVSQALGWHQPQPSGAAGRHRQRHGGALEPGLSPAPSRRTQQRTLSAGAGHRRALLHPPPGLRHHLLRPAAPQGLRRRAGPLGSRAGGLFPASGRQGRGAGGVHGSVQQLPRLGAQVLPQRPHRGRPLPRHPPHQPPLPGLLAGIWIRSAARTAACCP